MRKSPWDGNLVKSLREDNNSAWLVFLHGARSIIRGWLRSRIKDEDLDDECMKVFQRIYLDFKKWDPERGMSLESFIRLKVEDQWKRYCQKAAAAPEACSIDSLVEEGMDPQSEYGDPYRELEKSEHSAAVRSALAKMEPQEYVFLYHLWLGDSLALATARAGYPSSDAPENVIRRVKRRFLHMLESEPYFADNPDELAALRAESTRRRKKYGRALE